MLPGAAPIWTAFARLSRGRNVTALGVPCALTYRDVRDEAERVVCELPALTVQSLIELLDSDFLDWSSRDDNGKRSN